MKIFSPFSSYRSPLISKTVDSVSGFGELCTLVSWYSKLAWNAFLQDLIRTFSWRRSDTCSNNASFFSTFQLFTVDVWQHMRKKYEPSVGWGRGGDGGSLLYPHTCAALSASTCAANKSYRTTEEINKFIH